VSQPIGCFALVLHGHLPYVLGHGTWPHGSQMLYEAAADTYIPLLWTFRKLINEGVSPSVTMSLSPVLLEQLDDNRFKEWFASYLNTQIHHAWENEQDWSRGGDGHLAWLARRWAERYQAILSTFEELGRDIVKGFRELHTAGHLQLITSAATHGYLPLLHEDTSVQAQVKQAVATFRRLIGDWPRGMWLPECGYRPRARWAPPEPMNRGEIPYPRKGVEEFLADNGIDFFFADTHMLQPHIAEADVDRDNTLGKLWGRLRGLRTPSAWEGGPTPYAPYFVASCEGIPAVAVMVRDPATGLKVWSADTGYPGDYNYLEFHKKHIPGDLRYWRVTDAHHDLATKDVYHPDWAEERAKEHAGNFLWTVKETLRWAPREHRLPILCAPFDAELFGHWWHEGPIFLEHVLRWMHQDPDLEVVTCSQYLSRFPPTRAISLHEGSWGAGGGHWVWHNERVDWTWLRVYDAELDLRALLHECGPGHDDAMCALLAQAARELLLLQASDWQFLITTDGAPDYAAARLVAHHTDFKRLAQTARTYARGEWVPQEDWDHLGGCQDRDRLFPNIDPLWFRDLERPAY
jgi:1,4-alpha-glucan branching enzyme